MIFRNPKLIFVFILTLFLISCRSSRPVIDANYSSSTVPADSIVSLLPNYQDDIFSAKGKGRTIVSEPGNSDRLTIDFEADTSLSLFTIKNRIGIEGARMLVDRDSITFYNKIDKIAQKLSVNDGKLTSLNELASVNLLNVLNFKLTPNQVKEVFASETHYLLVLSNGGTAQIDINERVITKVTQDAKSRSPYSSIEYESYGKIDSYTLPRKITILSADGTSKVVFQVRSLDINPRSVNLDIDIPDGIIIERL
ncbi:MAG: DUF4292 domain-containing protein [Balneola sp.]|nr:MAG: DUF4292 domain-containing protein [Balneola sp.]